MRVKFVLFAEDFIEVSQAKCPPPRLESLRHEARLNRLGYAAFILGLAMVGLSCAALGWWHSPVWLLPLALELWFLMMVIRPIWSNSERNGVRQFFADDPQSGNPSTVEFDQTGLRYTDSFWICRLEWCAIDRFFETPSLFVITDDVPKSFLIPKRAFATNLEQDKFRRLVRDGIAACVGHRLLGHKPHP